MFFEITSLEGEILCVELSEVGACYPDDDVIYFSGVPCKLSSACYCPTKDAPDEANESLCVCGKPISRHNGVACLPETPRG